MARGLNGVQAVEADLDHGRDQRGEPAAAVHHDLELVRVAQVDEPPEVRQAEPAEQVLAQQRPGLAAEIVADEEDVDRVGRRVEDPLADRRVVIDDVLR